MSTNLEIKAVCELQNADVADEIMCHCSGTKRGNIQSLFEQGKDLDGISRWTGALTGCGGCEWDIIEFLNELAEQKNARS